MKKIKYIDALSIDDIDLIHQSKDCLAKWLCLFLYYTGLRISEAIALNVGNVKSDYVNIIGKGNKLRTIKLASKLKDEIIPKIKEHSEKYVFVDDDTPLFLTQKKTRLTRIGAWEIVKKYEKLIDKPIRISPHTLRHTFATQSLKRGVNIKYVSTALGHSSTVITQEIYQHCTLEDLSFVDIL